MAETTPAQQQYPNLNPYSNTNGSGATSAENAKNNVLNNAQSAMDSVKNSQTVQQLQNGPVADKARSEVANTQNEFGNLASSRQTPQSQTATGQNLTHYHSFFYNLLSWENPRATAISYAGIVLVIFATRYLPLARYALKGSFTVLGITAAAEIAGKLVFDQGFASKMRPRKYYTIPHETLESMLGDLEELVNFFVIEFQRIVFAENVYATIGAFATTLITYFLIKITPTWGLALFFTTLIYFLPLIYITNKELIDGHLENAGNMLNQQTSQIRDLASQHTSKAMEMSSSAFKDYSNKATEMMGGAKKSAVDKGYVSKETADKVPVGTSPAATDFPSAPKTEPEGASAAPVAEKVAEPAA